MIIQFVPLVIHGSFVENLLDVSGFRGTSGATRPRHHIRASIEFLALVAFLEKRPDGVVVLLGHREVGVLPVHPHAQTDRLLGLDLGVLSHPLLARLDETVDSVVANLLFRL